MSCPHCNATNSPFLPYSRPIEDGLAYAQVCPGCGHILGLRPRVESDPPAAPCDLTQTQIARLEFLRWRLQVEASQMSSAA